MSLGTTFIESILKPRTTEDNCVAGAVGNRAVEDMSDRFDKWEKRNEAKLVGKTGDEILAMFEKHMDKMGSLVKKNAKLFD